MGIMCESARIYISLAYAATQSLLLKSAGTWSAAVPQPVR